MLNVDLNTIQNPDPVSLVEDDDVRDTGSLDLFKYKNSMIWHLLNNDTEKLAYRIIGE